LHSSRSVHGCAARLPGGTPRATSRHGECLRTERNKCRCDRSDSHFAHGFIALQQTPFMESLHKPLTPPPGPRSCLRRNAQKLRGGESPDNTKRWPTHRSRRVGAQFSRTEVQRTDTHAHAHARAPTRMDAHALCVWQSRS
jgi:hypothetical protein